ncbi:MAG TPA: hypothetical protein PKG71_03975 [Candidatus Woesebacteria bacterium]|nr:hypothetical protein [Candidatus Woesebacteria bacterium]HNS95098.1 hypothetical protein [Candidatus Woesebacteria bacterium]
MVAEQQPLEEVALESSPKENASATPTVELLPASTPLSGNPADTQDLRATRATIQLAGSTTRSPFAVDQNTAKTLIEAMNQACLQVSTQITVLTRSHDEENQPLDSMEARIAFGKRIEWEINNHNNFIADEPLPSEEVCIAYGMMAFALTAEQLRVLYCGKKMGCTVSHDLLDRIRLYAGSAEICDFFRHDEFDEDPPYPSPFAYRKNREITMWGKIYRVVSDDGTMLEIYGPDRTSGFQVPKWAVERYNKHSVWELTTGTASLLTTFTEHTVQMGLVMVSQAGALHPAFSHGRFMWVLEPWARFSMDEKDETNGAHHFAADNKYDAAYTALKDQYGGKLHTVTEEVMARIPHSNVHQYERSRPTLAVIGLDIKAVDHHRINGALSAGMAIEVSLHFGNKSHR